QPGRASSDGAWCGASCPGVSTRRAPTRHSAGASMERFMKRFAIWSTIVGILALGCGGSGTKAGFMGRCGQDSDCEDGMICPKAGDLAGECTLPCEKDGICEAKGGKSAYCQTLHNNLCGMLCDTSSDCPTGHCKFGDYGGLYCIQ